MHLNYRKLHRTFLGYKTLSRKVKQNHLLNGKVMIHYIMAGHAIVVVNDINLLFYHGNAVILTLR